LEIVSNVVQESGWLQMQYTGKVTFQCSTATCNKRWTSVKRWTSTIGSNTGQHGKVKLFLGGQKCLKCNGVFENAMWHNLCIERAITKLLNKVKQKFYALNVPTSTTVNAYIQADMSAPHQTSLCENLQKFVFGHYFSQKCWRAEGGGRKNFFRTFKKGAKKFFRT
jgi:hypothetical protein